MKNRELEIKYEEERRKRIDCENIISSKVFENFSGPKRLESNEENIKDLLELANEELFRKSSIINKVYHIIIFSYKIKLIIMN